jgi:hypothetical protein
MPDVFPAALKRSRIIGVDLNLEDTSQIHPCAFAIERSFREALIQQQEFRA